MDVDITYQKNPLAGWDITVTATSGEGRQISAVRVTVNDFSVCDEPVNPSVKKWRRTFSQKGVYPGDNKCVATVTDDKGEDTSAMEQW